MMMIITIKMRMMNLIRCGDDLLMNCCSESDV